MTGKKVFTVKQVEDYLERMLGNDPVFRRICIRGEVSGCNLSNKGNLYFNLKDATGIIPSMIFKGWLDSACSFKMEDGQEIVAEGKLDYYRDRGTISFKVTKVELYGEGLLNLLFEQLKKRLTEEGLFDPAKKKPISKHPKKVGIVTSKSGDAVDDIEKTSKKRNPYVELILYPVTVQGKDSAAEFARGIKILDKMGVDTIIIGRGGGSKEDLEAFNDERLIRAVYEAETPIISATGHSKTWTLADYVADLRVITPTEAAVEAIPDLMKELRQIGDYRETLNRQIGYRVQITRSRINELEGKLKISGPEETLKRQMLTLRQLSERIHPAIQRKYFKELEQEEHLRSLLTPGIVRKVSQAVEKEKQLQALIHPAMQRKFDRTTERQSLLEEMLYPAMERKLDLTKRNAIALTNQLHALAPTAKLQGGFGYIELESKEQASKTSESGAEGQYSPLKSIADVKNGDKIRVTLHDGKLSATVDDMK